MDAHFYRAVEVGKEHRVPAVFVKERFIDMRPRAADVVGCRSENNVIVVRKGTPRQKQLPVFRQQSEPNAEIRLPSAPWIAERGSEFAVRQGRCR